MADTINLLDDREVLLSLLARKLETKPKNISFLFGKNSNNENDIAIPDLRIFSD